MAHVTKLLVTPAPDRRALRPGLPRGSPGLFQFVLRQSDELLLVGCGCNPGHARKPVLCGLSTNKRPH